MARFRLLLSTFIVVLLFFAFAVFTSIPTTIHAQVVPTNTPGGNNGNPYGGTTAAIPGTVQIENFNTGGQGVAYNDIDTTNNGGQYRTTEGVDIEATTDTGAGYNVGWTATNEWLKYTANVTAGGGYTLDFRVASTAAGGTFHLEVDGVNATGTLTIPNTGGWQTWATVTKTGVNLTAGQHVLRLVIDNVGGNLNWMRFTAVATDGSPYGGTAAAIPGTVQLENYNTGGQGVAYNDIDTINNGGQYRTAEGVDIEATTDTGAGYNVGWTATGEWLKYTVNVQTSGTYSADFRVASTAAGSTFHLEVDSANVTGTLTIPNTGGWQTWATVTKTGISLSAGQHVLRLVIDNVGGNLNWMSFSTVVTPTATSTSIPTSDGSPYSGTPAAVPGTVQFENYNTGGQGVAYNDSDTINNGGQYRTTEGVDIEATTDSGGGYNVGWTATGEWFKYTVNVQTADNYSINFRVASQNAGGTFHLEVDGGNVTGTMTVPATGGWQTWQTVTKTGVSLSAGQHVLRLVIDNVGGNFNWLSISTGSSTVDFGPNVYIFDPSMGNTAIQNQLNAVFSVQESNQFGTERTALLFKPGTYSVDANIGFNTQISGLGLSPTQVQINGYVRAEADWFGDNATQNFWRIAENISVTPPDGNNRWAVSQAAPFRRMYVHGQLQLDPRNHGWSSGGFLADSVVTGQVSSGTQQQYFTRNSEIGSWSNCSWNCVFVGVNGAPAQSFPTPPYTNVGSNPLLADKPFLYVDGAGNYQVFLPAMRTNSSGTTWNNKTPAGSSLPISQFYIVKPGATAADINNALAAGKDLIVTPGYYHINQTINVTRANTVILGLGLATFINDNGILTMNVADVDGVRIAGLLFEAGPTQASSLLQVGPSGSSASHSANPTILYDVFVRVGGVGSGIAKVTNAVVINSSNVIVDHTWIWRADHGDSGTPTGWTINTSDTGLIVNGANVTMYGLFVEHYQKYNVIWNGNGGRVYFFQNELPYDPPNQASYMNGSLRGYAAYKVANSVTTHEAWGLGSYAFYNVDPSIVNEHSFEVPQTAGVKFHDLLTISLGNKGTILHVINNTGAQTSTTTSPSNVVSYP